MVNYLLTHRGLISPDEEFVHTLTVTSPETDRMVVATAARDAFQAAWDTAVPLGMPSDFASAVDWTRVGAAEILDLSLGTLSAAALSTFAVPLSGTGSPQAAQVAIVVSLQAGFRPNGTPLRGRFYLPGPAAGTLSSLGRFNASDVQIWVDFVTDWFTNLVAAGLSPSVWSRTLAQINEVTSHRIGDVPDTMRSRRNQRGEIYTS